MAKTDTTPTLTRDDESQLRELLDLLNDFSMGRDIADADKPEIREAIWSLQKKPKRAGAASCMGQA